MVLGFLKDIRSTEERQVGLNAELSNKIDRLIPVGQDVITATEAEGILKYEATRAISSYTRILSIKSASENNLGKLKPMQEYFPDFDNDIEKISYVFSQDLSKSYVKAERADKVTVYGPKEANNPEFFWKLIEDLSKNFDMVENAFSPVIQSQTAAVPQW